MTEAEVERVVEAAFSGEASLEKLVNKALFGTRKLPSSMTWGDWPQYAIDAWDLAVKLFTQRVKELEASPTPVVSRREAWDAVEQAVPEGRSFPSLAHVRNREVPLPSGVDRRTFFRTLLQEQGWAFAGRGGSRRVVRAPCVSCGVVVKARAVVSRQCPECAEG